MRICILSNKGECLNEGQRNVAAAFTRELEVRHNVLHFNAKELIKIPSRWNEIKNFNPDILLFFLRPRFSTFLFARFCRLYFGKVPVFFSALQPAASSIFQASLFLKYFRPTCVMTLTTETESFFKKMGITTSRISCGVDIEKFKESTEEDKIRLKKKYGFETSLPIVLHVGHLTRGRNLNKLVREDASPNLYQLVIVVSPMFKPDKGVEEYLKNRGVQIIRDHVANINEIYQLADLYVFPVINHSFSIEAPLSVFEAMATNLPVISTKFGVLKSYFEPGDGLIYVDDPADIPKQSEMYFKENPKPVNTRLKVSSYTWKKAASQLETNFKDILMARTKQGTGH